MRTVSAQFLAAVREPHRIVLTCDAYPPGGGGPIPVPIDGGQVIHDRTALHRSQLQGLIVSDPGLYPTDPTAPLAPYGSELHVQRGVQYVDGSQELVSLGWFRIQDGARQLPGTDAFTIDGWCRSIQVADQRFTSPTSVGPGTHVAVAEALISAVYPSSTFVIGGTPDSTSIAAHVVDQDRWGEVVALATAIGYEVYPDADGTWQFQPVPDPSSLTSVWTVDAGPSGVLVQAADNVTRDGVYNGIMATGQPTNGATPVSYLAKDNDASSPTYWLGAFGKVPGFYSSPLIRTTGQAQTAAIAVLNNQLGIARSVTLQSAPNPALEAGDAITVTYPDGSNVVHLVDAVTIPLKADGQVQLDSRVRVASGAS